MSARLFTHRFKVMGGPAEVQLYAETEAQANEAFAIACEEVTRIEQKYSRYDPRSIISQINQSAGAEAVAIDEETDALLQYATLCFKQSEGRFDITSGVLRRVWNFNNSRPPTAEAIQEILPLIGLMHSEHEERSFGLSKAGMEIDFGGIGKEYAVDRAAVLLQQAGITSALVNLAGDVRALGPQGDGSPWVVGITHPRKVDSTIAGIELYSGSLATSGDYERFIEVGEKRYCHILNPHTGWPAQGLQSVSVLADTCLLAGTTASCAMLVGEKEAKQLLRSSGLAHLIVSADGRVTQSAGMPGEGMPREEMPGEKV